MSDDMIERVWRAMGEAISKGDVMQGTCNEYIGGYISEGSSIFDLEGQMDLAVLARAAIEAMREPTPAMWEAGNDAIEEKRDYSQDTDGTYECTDFSDLAVPAFRAMIDAALAS